MKVLIVGGVAGGASAAARLRRLDEAAEIILFEQGEHISFANCGLPYFIGGVIRGQAELLLQTPESFRGRFCVDVRVLFRVTRILPDKKRVEVRNLRTGEAYEESYDKLILSPGASPIRPKLPGVDAPGVFTLRSVPDALAIDQFLRDSAPGRAVVIGGGNIGVELAENLCLRGLEVSLVEAASHVVTALDGDMAAIVQRALIQKGVRLRLGCRVSAIQGAAGAGLRVVTDQGDLPADMVLLCVGVSPDSALAREAGLKLGDRGSIAVDDGMQTSDPHIYAVGDAVETVELVTGQRRNIALAGPANRQGRIAADRIAGLSTVYRKTQASSVLKVFELTAACTGLSEEAAQKSGVTYDKVYLYSGAHAGYYPDAKPLSAKILFDPVTGKILGGQFIGEEGADKRCDVLAVALRAGMNASDLAALELCYAPPFSSAKDPVNMAGYAIENIVTGKVKNFHWEKLHSLDRQRVTLLDVRAAEEYAEGCVPGFVNIPLHELRQRLTELPADKPVYVHCLSGLRSYVACRVLTGHGYDCHNISGGYYLYGVRASAPG